MNLKLLFLTVLSAMIFIGCSTENVTFTSANGDELAWESTEVFINELGLYAGGVLCLRCRNGAFHRC